MLGEAPGRDLNRIFISSPGVSFWVVVSTDWSVPGHESLVNAAGPKARS